MISTLERFQGCLVGLAVGDAMGAAVEFKARGTFPPVKHYQSGGPFNLLAGQWTDDTSMALCLAASLIEKRGFDPIDQLKRYVRWFREGYQSSTGFCFDIGNTTRASLEDFENIGGPYRPDPEELATGSNGSIMRLAPVPMFFYRNPQQAVEQSANSSRTTHPARDAVDACRYLGCLISAALSGIDKKNLLAPFYASAEDYWQSYPLSAAIQSVAAAGYRHKDASEIHGDGLAAHCLEAALWAFDHTSDFASGCLLAINLGEDTDTTAAVYGQIAGACYGLQGIPPAWREGLFEFDRIAQTAADLLASAV